MAWYDNPLIRRVVALMGAGILALVVIDAASLWLAARTDRYSMEVGDAREFPQLTASLLGLMQDMGP